MSVSFHVVSLTLKDNKDLFPCWSQGSRCYHERARELSTTYLSHSHWFPKSHKLKSVWLGQLCVPHVTTMCMFKRVWYIVKIVMPLLFQGISALYRKWQGGHFPSGAFSKRHSIVFWHLISCSRHSLCFWGEWECVYELVEFSQAWKHH